MAQLSVQHKDWKVYSELASSIIIRTSEIKTKTLRELQRKEGDPISHLIYITSKRIRTRMRLTVLS